MNSLILAIIPAAILGLGGIAWQDHNTIVKHEIVISQTEDLRDELHDYFRVQKNRAEKDAERFGRILETFPTPTPDKEDEDK